jgi:hypothetical protein
VPHSFTVVVRDELAVILSRLESEITGKGGRFEGNAERGRFAGKSMLGVIKGEYRGITETEIMITITDKPFAVPFGMIESEIRKYFG